MSFNESSISRGGDGKFAAKATSESDVSLGDTDQHAGVCYNCGSHLYRDENWTKGWRCPDCTEPLCDDCMVDDMDGLCGDCMDEDDRDGWGDDDDDE